MTTYSRIPNIKNVSIISNIIFKNFLYYYNKNDNVNLCIHDFPNIIGTNENRVSLKQYIIQHELYNNKKNFHIIVSNYPSAIWTINDDDETIKLPNFPKHVNGIFLPSNKFYYFDNICIIVVDEKYEEDDAICLYIAGLYINKRLSINNIIIFSNDNYNKLQHTYKINNLESKQSFLNLYNIICPENKLNNNDLILIRKNSNILDEMFIKRPSSMNKYLKLNIPHSLIQKAHTTTTKWIPIKIINKINRYNRIIHDE